MNITDCAAALRQGELVAVPTETVYGLAANALDDQAVHRIYAAKGRPAWNPLIVHVGSTEEAKQLAVWNGLATKLAESLWPGPLTLVLPDRGVVSRQVLAGGNTIGLRLPNHSLFLSLLLETKLPLAAPSGNKFTELSPTRFEDINPDILEHCSGALNGGPCVVGIESTVVAVNSDSLSILRHGMITQSQLQEYAPTIVAENSELNASPGQHYRHYSPRNPVILVEPGSTTDRLIALTRDPKDFARTLYSKLAELDRTPGSIHVERPPETAEWAAIWDRLRRAASDGP